MRAKLHHERSIFAAEGFGSRETRVREQTREGYIFSRSQQTKARYKKNKEKKKNIIRLSAILVGSKRVSIKFKEKLEKLNDEDDRHHKISSLKYVNLRMYLAPLLCFITSFIFILLTM